jgi:transposase
MAALEQAASLQYRLAQDPEAVFEELMRADDRRVRWLIEEGRADREQAAQLTRLAVEILAKAADREGAHVA